MAALQRAFKRREIVENRMKIAEYPLRAGSDGKVEIFRMSWVDLDDLAVLGREFFNDSDYRDLTFDEELFRTSLVTMANNSMYRVLLARVNGLPAGYTCIMATRDFSKEMIGDFCHFYIRREYRGMGVSRAFVEETLKQYDEWGCKKNYAAAASGVRWEDKDEQKNVQYFINLWKKYGFRQTGVIMTRECI